MSFALCNSHPLFVCFSPMFPHKQHFLKKSQKSVDTNRHIWYYKVVESDKSCRILLKGGETMKKVIHAEYVFIPAYQKRKKLTDENISKKLGMSIRTYRDKVKGYGDFTLTEANKICELLEETKDNLFY